MPNRQLAIFAVIMLSLPRPGDAQIIDVKKTAENAVINRTNQTINQGINMGVNAIFNAPGKIYQKIKTRQQTKTNDQANYPTSYGTTTAPTTNSSVANGYSNPSSQLASNYTPTDFIAGASQTWSENFTNTVVGKYPTNWITNANGEVRVVNDQHWLQLSTNGMYAPQPMPTFSQNFSLEFDFIFNPQATADTHYLVYLYNSQNTAADLAESNYPGNGGMYLSINPFSGEIDVEAFDSSKNNTFDFHTTIETLKTSVANSAHMAIQKSGQHVRFFLNDHEVFGATHIISEGNSITSLKFAAFYLGKDDFALISNIKVSTQ